MDMTAQYRNNYFKLVALIVDVASFVIWNYIREKILGPDSFEVFLNREKHTFLHIYETTRCCQCDIPKSGKRLLSSDQLSILYNSDDEKQNKYHKKYDRNKVTQICICKYSSKENIAVEVLDITLAKHIIKKWGKQELGIDSWMKDITVLRNKIFHLSNIHEMTDAKFSRKWKKLKGSIMGIANSIVDSSCAVETKKRIKQTKKITIFYDYVLKHEKICRDDWKNKCAEFKNAQQQIIEEESALHYTIPQLFSRSMGKDCQKTMKQIENLLVDKINVMIKMFGIDENVEKLEVREAMKEDMQIIRIPVCMQLDIPTSWDKTKVFDALDKARLNGTPDMNIRIKAISIDDLNIFADISNKLLHNVDVFCSEINTMMSTMLSEAAIDTEGDEQLCVNLEVQDVSGVPNADDIIEPKEEIGTPPDSSDLQCSTTESVANMFTNNPSAVNMSERKEEIKIGELPLNFVIQQCSTTDPDEITPTTACTEEAIVQTSLKNNLPVSANFRQKLKISKNHFWNKDPDISGCIKIDNTLVFSDYDNKQLIICNSDGTDKHHMSLSYEPWYITEIDSNTVAVSCRDYNTILIINISTRSFTSRINTCGHCHAISYNDNNLYVVINWSIQVMDLTGKVIRTILVPSDLINDITVDRDRLVCRDRSSIYCCSLDGKLMWKFKKDEFRNLRGVTTDNDGNVYVTNEKTHTVLVVSDDGKHHRELLTESDGLDEPWGIYFDKKENILLVSNRDDGQVFLFDVKKKP